MVFFTNDTQITLAELKTSSRMHCQDLRSKKKISISETKTNVKHCKMDWLSICGNILDKLFIQENINDCISPKTQPGGALRKKSAVLIRNI